MIDWNESFFCLLFEHCKSGLRATYRSESEFLQYYFMLVEVLLGLSRTFHQKYQDLDWGLILSSDELFMENECFFSLRSEL